VEVHICHLYPDLMNLYGDRGNIIALARRARWHGLEPVLHTVQLGDRPDFARYDVCFVGGGQDKEQRLIGDDLASKKGAELRAAVEDGLVLLAVCGGYQLLGEYYETGAGDRIPGVGLLDCRTRAGRRRMIGNLVLLSYLDFSSGPAAGSAGGPGAAGTGRAPRRRTLVGFENHSGRTYLGPGVSPLGQVLVGHGNNGEDRQEGAVYKNCVGTYLHGSALPKNPWLTDYCLRQALLRRYGRADLRPLDDRLEEEAHLAAIRLAARA